MSNVFIETHFLSSLSLVDGSGLSEFAARNLKDWNISLNNSFYAYLIHHYSNETKAIERGNSIKHLVNLVFHESVWRFAMFKGQSAGIPEHEQQNYFRILCDK